MDIRERTPLERVYEEVYDDDTGLYVRVGKVEKQLEPITRFWGAIKWPAGIIGTALGLYLTAQVVKLLERLPNLFGP